MGRKHVGYGSNVKQMEILGLLIAKSLLKAIPIEEVGEEKFERIDQAYLVLFRIIVYWLQFGFNYQTRSIIWEINIGVVINLYFAKIYDNVKQIERFKIWVS